MKLRRENPDLLELCHTVPMEVITAGEVARWAARGQGRLGVAGSRLGRAPPHHCCCFLSTSALSLSPFPEKQLLDPDHSDNYAAFKKWLRCYLVPGMSSLRDRSGRTVWFQVGARGLQGQPCGGSRGRQQPGGTGQEEPSQLPQLPRETRPFWLQGEGA